MAKKKVKQEIEAKEPRPVGRPSKYKPEYDQLLIDHMSEGLSYESFAGLIEVNVDTLFEWEKVHSSFSESKKVAFQKSLIFWEKLGIEHILNTSESESFGEGVSKSQSKSLNAAVWVFNMKNRFKWRDKQPEESDTININLSLADRIAKARGRVEKK